MAGAAVRARRGGRRDPRISAKDPDSVQWPPEVVADGPIALARLIGAGVDVRGKRDASTNCVVPQADRAAG